MAIFTSDMPNQFASTLALRKTSKVSPTCDSTTPTQKENKEYVDSILADVRWLVSGDVDGPDPWDGAVRHASDYFDTFYAAAVHLIKKGKAYVESLSAEEMREFRGSLKAPGRDSPHRGRSVEENLEMFEKMRNGDYAEGECVRLLPPRCPPCTLFHSGPHFDADVLI